VLGYIGVSEPFEGYSGVECITVASDKTYLAFKQFGRYIRWLMRRSTSSIEQPRLYIDCMFWWSSCPPISGPWVYHVYNVLRHVRPRTY